MRSKLWLAFAALALLLACPGRLADPEEFLDGGGGGGGGTGGGGTGGGGADGGACNAEVDIFQAKCGTVACHAAPAAAADGLDLISAGVKQRLEGMATCQGLPLKTYMLTKVTSASPNCGAQMPLGGPYLSADLVQCLTDYLATVGADGGP